MDVMLRHDALDLDRILIPNDVDGRAPYQVGGAVCPDVDAFIPKEPR